MNLSDYEILGFNLGGLFMVLPLVVILLVILWHISKSESNSD